MTEEKPTNIFAWLVSKDNPLADQAAAKAIFEQVRNLIAIAGIAAAVVWLFNDKHWYSAVCGAVLFGCDGVLIGLFVFSNAAKIKDGTNNSVWMWVFASLFFFAAIAGIIIFSTH
jgi:hypothetical protein